MECPVLTVTSFQTTASPDDYYPALVRELAGLENNGAPDDYYSTLVRELGGSENTDAPTHLKEFLPGPATRPPPTEIGGDPGVSPNLATLHNVVPAQGFNTAPDPEGIGGWGAGSSGTCAGFIANAGKNGIEIQGGSGGHGGDFASGGGGAGSRGTIAGFTGNAGKNGTNIHGGSGGHDGDFASGGKAFPDSGHETGSGSEDLMTPASAIAQDLIPQIKVPVPYSVGRDGSLHPPVAHWPQAVTLTDVKGMVLNLFPCKDILAAAVAELMEDDTALDSSLQVDTKQATQDLFLPAKRPFTEELDAEASKRTRGDIGTTGTGELTMTDNKSTSRTQRTSKGKCLKEMKKLYFPLASSTVVSSEVWAPYLTATIASFKPRSTPGPAHRKLFHKLVDGSYNGGLTAENVRFFWEEIVLKERKNLRNILKESTNGCSFEGMAVQGDRDLPVVTQKTRYLSKITGADISPSLNDKHYRVEETACCPKKAVALLDVSFGKHASSKLVLSCHGLALGEGEEFADHLELVTLQYEGEPQSNVPLVLRHYASRSPRTGSAMMLLRLMRELEEIGKDVVQVNCSADVFSAIFAAPQKAAVTFRHTPGQVQLDWNEGAYRKVTPLLLAATVKYITEHGSAAEALHLQKVLDSHQRKLIMPSEIANHDRSGEHTAKDDRLERISTTFPLMSAALKAYKPLKSLWSLYIILCRHNRIPVQHRSQDVDPGEVLRRLVQLAEDLFKDQKVTSNLHALAHFFDQGTLHNSRSQYAVLYEAREVLRTGGPFHALFLRVFSRVQAGCQQRVKHDAQVAGQKGDSVVLVRGMLVRIRSISGNDMTGDIINTKAHCPIINKGAPRVNPFDIMVFLEQKEDRAARKIEFKKGDISGKFTQGPGLYWNGHSIENLKDY